MAALVATLLWCASAGAASVTGEWDFHSGDLSATVGQDLEYLDGPLGSTAAGTVFGTARSLGLPPIGGQDLPVMKIPNCSVRTMGYKMYPGIAANGGGAYVNQYTIVMDLYCPSYTLGSYKSLYNASSTNINDGDLFIYQGKIGTPGVVHGVANSDTWHRIAWSVNGTVLKKYVDGTLVGAQTLEGSIDGRWSLYTASDGMATLLFADNSGDTNVLYTSFIQIRDYAVADAEAAALGGPAGTPGFIVLPYLQNAKTDGITVMWELNRNPVATVEYGSTTSYGSSTTCTLRTTEDGTHLYKAVLTGLTPGTIYHYRPVIGGVACADSTFRTSPAVLEDFKFGYWADSQGAVSGTANPYEPVLSILNHMIGRGIAFGLTGGDLSENGSQIYDTRRYFLDRVLKYVGRSVPWYAAWGNHDTYNASGNLTTVETFIRHYADFPSKDRAGLTPGTGSYSFDYSGCHFICLDVMHLDDVTNGWLLSDLQSAASRSARFRFLVVHYPPYCELWYNGDAGLRTNLVPLLETYRVSVCFSGHTHEHERGMQNGVHYIISGGASWLDTGEALVYDWPFMTVGGYDTMPGTTIGGCLHNYLECSVTGNQCTIAMHAFNADGSYREVVDTVTFASPTSGWYFY